jgi:Flp pilus assembly pilin Flp
MVKGLTYLLRNEDGQDLTEYGLLGAFISVISLVTVQEVGPLVNNFFLVIRKTLQQ